MIYSYRQLIKEGGLMSYGPETSAIARARAAGTAAVEPSEMRRCWAPTLNWKTQRAAPPSRSRTPKPATSSSRWITSRKRSNSLLGQFHGGLEPRRGLSMFLLVAVMAGEQARVAPSLGCSLL